MRAVVDELCVGVRRNRRTRHAGSPRESSQATAIGSPQIITNLLFERRLPVKKKFLIALLVLFVSALALAQQGPPQQLTGVSAANQQSLSSSLGLHAFPSKDQTPQQRQTDET